MDFPEEISQDIISQLSTDDIAGLGLVVRGNTLHDRVWNAKLATLGYGPVPMAQGMWFLVNTKREPEEQLVDIINTGLGAFFDSFVRRWPGLFRSFLLDNDSNGDNRASLVEDYPPAIVERLRRFLAEDHELILESFASISNSYLDFRRLIIDAVVDFLTDEEVADLIAATPHHSDNITLAITEIAIRRPMDNSPYSEPKYLDYRVLPKYKLLTGALTPRDIEEARLQLGDEWLKESSDEYQAIGEIQAKSHDDKILYSYISLIQATRGDEDVRTFLNKNLDSIVEHHQLQSALFLRTMTVEYLARLFSLARQQGPALVVKLVKMIDYDGEDAVTLTNTTEPNPFDHTFTILTDDERTLHGGSLRSKRSMRSKYRLGF